MTNYCILCTESKGMFQISFSVEANCLDVTVWLPLSCTGSCNFTGCFGHVTWLSAPWPSAAGGGVGGGGLGGGAGAPQPSGCYLTPALPFSLLVQPPLSLQLLFVTRNLPSGLVETEVAGGGGRWGNGQWGHFLFFPCHLCLCTRGSVWGILNYFTKGRCFNPTSCPLASSLIWVTRLCLSDWFRCAAEREKEKGRQRFSLSTL